MIIEMPLPYRSDYLSFAFAQEPWQLRQYYAVRKTIFCDEQKLFVDSDRDETDDTALPIVALDTCGGMLDRVVGVVRIDERQPGVWYGGRLGVIDEYRKLNRFGVNGLFNDEHTVSPFDRSIGAGLIYKAVSSAKAMGCQQFFANVQIQNVSFFERMHWRKLFVFDAYGMPHARMEANLNCYPASRLVSAHYSLAS